MPDRSGRSSIGVRVRPNAHRFIRDLNAELQTKKATFWVTVGAKTTQATRDVRAWANTDLKQIKAIVPVDANTGAATATVAAWRRRQSKFTTTVPVEVNLAEANRQLAVWREYAGRDLRIKVTADQDRGVDALRRSLGRGTKMSVRADTDKVRNDLKAAVEQPGLFDVDVSTKKARFKINEFFGEMRGTQLELDLGIDTKPAETKVAVFSKEAARKDVLQQLNIDTKKARLELLLLNLEAKRNKLHIPVELDTRSAQLRAKLQKMQKTIGSGSIIRSMDVGPFNLGRPTGMLGSLTSLTAMATVLPGVVTLVAALSNGLISLGAAASLLPGALGGVVASLGVAAIGFKGFGDALSAMFDMWGEGSDKMQTQAKATATAQNQLRNSLVDEKRAQEDVGKARRDATRELRDQNNELRSGVLNEAQAILDLQRARDRLAQGGFSNETERVQAMLDERKAQQQLIEVRERNMRTQIDATEADAKGVEGSDRVQDALEAQARATQAVSAAMEAVNAAQEQGGAASFADALGKLSPNAREAVMAIAGLKGELMDFKLAIQDTVFAGVGPALQSTFAELLPVLQPGMQAIAEGLNRNILQVFDTLESGPGQSIIERILGGTAQAQQAMTKVIDPLIRGIGTLTAAGAEHLPQIVDLVGRLADRFANFIEKADRSGDLDAFLDRGVKALGDMVDIGVNLVKVINDLSNAFGGDFLQTLKDTTAEWHEGLASDAGQKKVKKFIGDAKQIFESWKPVLADLPNILTSIGDAARVLLSGLLPVINLFTSAASKWPTLTAALVGAFMGSRVLLGVLSPVFTVLKGASSIMKWMIATIPRLAGIAKLLNMPGFGGPMSPFGYPIGVDGPDGKGGGKGGGGKGGFWSKIGALLPFSVHPVALAAAAATAAGTAGGLRTYNYSQNHTGNETWQSALLSVFGAMTTLGGNPAPIINPKGIVNPLGADLRSPEQKTRDEAYEKYRGLVDQGFTGDRIATDIYGPGATTTMTREELEENARINKIPGFKSGGYTSWGVGTGHLAVLHGKEYVQPADTTAYYGVDAMRALHEKRIPREFLQGFDDGGYNDPNDPRKKNPAAPILPSLGASLSQGLGSMAATVGAAGGDVFSSQHGGLGGAAPGPVDVSGPMVGSPMVGSPMGGADTPTLDLFGFKVPLGQGVGWPGGSPPVGLGGGMPGPNGEAPFDIRNYGFGPGPAGSTPSDWMSWTANFAADTLVKFGSALTAGALGVFGLEGLMNNPYIGFGKALGGHFASAASGDGKAQDSRAGEANAAALNALGVYDSMGMNPMGGGVGMMPQVFDPMTGQLLTGGGSTGSDGGLQTYTLMVKKAIERAFPQIKNIGGYRQDALKWHPGGYAIDVMIPGAGGLNDPTPPEGKMLGDTIYRWLMAHKEAFHIDYILWQVKDHFNHLHVNTTGGGYPNGAGPPMMPGVSTPDMSGFNMSGFDTSDFNLTYTPGDYLGGWMNGMSRPTWGQALDGPTPPGGRPKSPSPPPTPKSSGPKNPLDVFAPTNPKSPGPTNPLDVFAPQKKRFDSGGWLPTGVTTVVNNTTKPELVIPYDRIPGFALGGLNQGAIVPPPVKPLPPRGPDARTINPARPVPPPRPTVTAPVPGAAGPPVPGPAAPTAPQPTEGRQPEWTPTPQRTDSTGPSTDPLMHLHPALQKGIMSTASVLGNIAATAAQMGMMGAGGGGGAGAGGMGGGLMSSMISGAFQQGGKIATNVANVGASFLVGNITGGTTENAYGVTQMPSQPSGGTKVYDASTTIGSIQTADLDEYYRRENIRQAQRAQGALGSWGARV